MEDLPSKSSALDRVAKGMATVPNDLDDPSASELKEKWSKLIEVRGRQEQRDMHTKKPGESMDHLRSLRQQPQPLEQTSPEGGQKQLGSFISPTTCSPDKPTPNNLLRHSPGSSSKDSSVRADIVILNSSASESPS